MEFIAYTDSDGSSVIEGADAFCVHQWPSCSKCYLARLRRVAEEQKIARAVMADPVGAIIGELRY